MMAKGKIQAEEYRQQIAERLPIAVRAMEIATGKSSAEINKMMERGELISKDVLPKFGSALRDIVQENGALTKAIETVRVKESQFTTQLQKSADLVFRSGFGEQLANLYKTLTEELKSTGKTQEDLGNIYANFFKMLSKLVKVVTPLLEGLIQVISKITDVVMYSVSGWEMLGKELNKLPTPLKAVALGVTAIGLAFKSTMAKGVLLLGLFHEIASLFDDKLVGVLEARMGTQFNFATMQQTALKQENGKFFSAGKPQDMLSTSAGKGVFGAAGLAALATGAYTIVKMIEAFKILTKTMGAFRTAVVASTVSLNKKVKGTTGMGLASLTTVTAATAALAAPVAYAAHETNQNKDTILDQARMGELGSRAQRALQRADEAWKNNPSNMATQMNNSRNTMGPSPSNYVTLNPVINVNIDGSSMNSVEAGKMVADTAMEALERNLSMAVREGRY